jgi:hypothetical protein
MSYPSASTLRAEHQIRLVPRQQSLPLAKHYAPFVHYFSSYFLFQVAFRSEESKVHGFKNRGRIGQSKWGDRKEETSMDERFKMRLTSLTWALLSSTAPFLELEWDGGRRGAAWGLL